MTVFSYYDYDIIISIDLGNAYSSSCFSFVPKNRDYGKRELSIINCWPEQLKNRKSTIPTVCLYRNNCAGLFKWGHEAIKYWRYPGNSKQNIQLVEKFMQKLIFNSETGENFDMMYTKAAIDYLKTLYQHTLGQLTKTSMVVDRNRKDKVRFVLTVPEHWTDDNKHLLRLICIEAGLISKTDDDRRLHIIGDFFASTIYCERNFIKSNPDGLQNGMRFLICDAGGSTVKLGTYQCTGPNQELNGLCNGYSLLDYSVEEDCGSELLDEAMKEFILRVIFVNEEERKIYKHTFDYLLASFDTYKDNFYWDAGFDYDEDDDYYLMLATVDLRNLSKSSASISKHFGPYEFEGETFQVETALSDRKDIEYIFFSKKEIKEQVFDPVIDKTMEVIKKHIEKANTSISTTFLLGGFGSSPYLQSRLQEKAEEFKLGKLVFDCENPCEKMIGALYYSDILGSCQNIE